MVGERSISCWPGNYGSVDLLQVNILMSTGGELFLFFVFFVVIFGGMELG